MKLLALISLVLLTGCTMLNVQIPMNPTVQAAAQPICTKDCSGSTSLTCIQDCEAFTQLGVQFANEKGN